MAHDDTGEIRTMLRRVLRDGGVYAVLQPIRRDRYPVMVEALARFRGPLGEHPVEEVIAVAEASDVVHAVSEIVLRDALTLVGAAPHWHGQVAWNVSPTHLRRPDFARRLDAILAERRFPIERLVIEVTESTLFDDHDCIQVLAALRGRGASIAIDDFGTGWSSISRLATLPVDIVKIDRSLITDVTSRRGGDIVRSVMSLCLAIGATTVAEGVETVSQLDALERLHDGTHLLQGFLTGRPTRDVDVALIGAAGPMEHAVCLYDTDDAFTREVCSFLAAGHEAFEPTVAVLVPGRIARVRAELTRRGIDPSSSEIELLDAESTLQSILTDGSVDPAKFQELTSALIARHPTQRMRCCGEMVTMLWDRGDVLGALLLEDLWNRAAQGTKLTILCGYPTAIAAHASHHLAVDVLHSELYTTTVASSSPMPPAREERRRTAELHALGLLGQTRDHTFDAVTDLAIKVFDTDYAFVSLIDTDRQWFASRLGFEDTDSARDIAFCAHTIMSDEPLIVHDARRDRRFHDNPFVTEPPHIIFYAGAPIHAPNGSRIGTVCVASSNPRRFSQPDRRHLTHLASIVDSLIAQRAEAVTDPLTGLYNRRGFLDTLHRLTNGTTDDLAVVLADIDGLKALNDNRGHAAGDRALLAVATVLSSTLLDASIIARIGGDEFAAVYTGAAATADLQTAVAVQDIDADVLPIGLSAATATRRPGDTSFSLLARADHAMYANKQGRRSRVKRISPT